MITGKIFPSVLALFSLASLSSFNAVGATVIADFVDDYPAVNGAGPQFDGTETPATGWDYMWNPGGTADLGNAANYQSLVPNTVNLGSNTVDDEGLFTRIGDIAFNDAGQGSFRYGRIGLGTSHPGQSGSDYRAIFAYTIQPGEAGGIAISNSSLAKANSTGTSIDLDVYVNDSLVGALSIDGFNSTTPTQFDGALGELAIGDTVYVTVGHDGNPSSDAFVIDFSLVIDIDPDADDDNDGLKDVWELEHFKNLDQSGTDNPDGDGADNEAEETAGTDPNKRDTDDDGLDDDVEIAGPTDPLDPDSDDDQLLDGAESNTGIYVSSSDTGTDPMLNDTDDDGVLDGIEIKLGSDPFDAGRVPAELPNIIFIMVDDLDYREVGVYGQATLQTPRLDTMASQGMRFTDFYSASPVCHSSRSCLITGQDSRRSQDRFNGEVGGGYQYPLHPARVTIAEVLKEAGYTTGCVGKWGMGGPTTNGVPWQQGFDLFVGYLGQVQAHYFYPKYLWKNDQKIFLNQAEASANGGTLYVPGANNPNVATNNGWTDNFGNVCSHDVAVKEGLQFIEDNANRPFFLYCAWTPPHLNYFPAASLSALTDGDGLVYDPTDLSQTLINELYPGAPFGGTAETPNYQPHAYASMVSAVDRDTGRILDKLVELGIDDKTLVIFCSDNGEATSTFLNPAHLQPGLSDLRGIKRSLYEGGIRSPFIAWWPGKIPAGTTSDVIGTFSDMLPTFTEVAGLQTPTQITGRSILPVLLGGSENELQPRAYHYWSFTEGSRRLRAVRQGDWKLLRMRATNGSPPTYELYNLATDLYETTNLANIETAVRDRLIPLVEGSHEVTDAKYFTADDEFFTRTNLVAAAYQIDTPDGSGAANGYTLTPTGTGTGFNYLPFETGLIDTATFTWTFEFPSTGAASLLLGPSNDPAQCLGVRVDAASMTLETSFPGAASASAAIGAADLPGNRAECLLSVNPVTGAGKVVLGSTTLTFDFSVSVGPLRFWGYEVESAAVRASRPRWQAGAPHAAIHATPGGIDVHYSLPATAGQSVTPQYSADLESWHDNPPGLVDIRATNSQGQVEGAWHLPADSLLPRMNERLFLRGRRDGE